ncbi:MAG: hypothetical protein GC136_03130 [Alphaproteobacteria bacterium]|nr:hypothetical protein [Alphaproteobacteria bacterium]
MRQIARQFDEFETPVEDGMPDLVDPAAQRLIADLIALDDTGQKLDIEVTDTPVDALLSIGCALDDYAALKGLGTEDLKRDIARQMMYFARLVPAEQLYARLFITDTKPPQPDYNPLHIKVYDGTRRHGDDFLQAVRTSTIYGTRTSVQSGTDIGALFESGKDKRLILIVGTRKNDDAQMLGVDMGSALEALAAAGMDPALQEEILQLLADNPDNAELQLLVSLMADYYLNKNEASIPALLQQVVALQAILGEVEIPLPAGLTAQIQAIFSEMGGEALITRMAAILDTNETTIESLDLEVLVAELEALLPLLEAESALPAEQIDALKEKMESLREAITEGITPETLSLLLSVQDIIAPVREVTNISPTLIAKLETINTKIDKEAPKALLAIAETVSLSSPAPTSTIEALSVILREQPRLSEIIAKPLEAQPALRDRILQAVTTNNPALINAAVSTPAIAASLPAPVKHILVSLAQAPATPTAPQVGIEIKTATLSPKENVVVAASVTQPTQNGNTAQVVQPTIPAQTAAAPVTQEVAQIAIAQEIAEVRNPALQEAKVETPVIKTGGGPCGNTDCHCGPTFKEAAGTPVNLPVVPSIEVQQADKKAQDAVIQKYVTATLSSHDDTALLRGLAAANKNVPTNPNSNAAVFNDCCKSGSCAHSRPPEIKKDANRSETVTKAEASEFETSGDDDFSSDWRQETSLEAPEDDKNKVTRSYGLR